MQENIQRVKRGASGGRAFFVTDNFCTANVSSVRQRPAATTAAAANVSSVRQQPAAAAATAARGGRQTSPSRHFGSSKCTVAEIGNRPTSALSPVVDV